MITVLPLVQTNIQVKVFSENVFLNVALECCYEMTKKITPRYIFLVFLLLLLFRIDLNFVFLRCFDLEEPIPKGFIQGS